MQIDIVPYAETLYEYLRVILSRYEYSYSYTLTTRPHCRHDAQTANLCQLGTVQYLARYEYQLVCTVARYSTDVRYSYE